MQQKGHTIFQRDIKDIKLLQNPMMNKIASFQKVRASQIFQHAICKRETQSLALSASPQFSRAFPQT